MKKLKVGKNSFFIGETFAVGKNFVVGSNTTIMAKNFFAGDYVCIGSNNEISVAENFSIGNCSVIKNNNKINGRNIVLGDYLYLDSQVLIGHGGSNSVDSSLKIGNACMICSKSTININYEVTIGNNVGIGEGVDLWTHGSFLAVLEGFPAQFGGVSVGNNVWIPAKSTILPNVEIGDNVVMGIGTVVTKSIKSGALVVGNPHRIIKQDCYPKKISQDRRIQLVNNILSEYKRQADYKEIKSRISFDPSLLTIDVDGALFDLERYAAPTELTVEQEDFRDFLRRRGIKIFTGKPFRSIPIKSLDIMCSLDLQVDKVGSP